jgi:NTE family protein
VPVLVRHYFTNRRSNVEHFFPLRLKAWLVVAVAVFFLAASCAPKEAVKQAAPGRPPRIALVLGAGASRGFAHIGVLKILQVNSIPINMIVGTSAGSFVGSLYAYGYDAYQLQKMALAIEKSDIVDLAMPDNGFIKGEKLAEYVNKMVRNTPIERMRIPFYAVATAVPSGKEVVFGKGNTGTAVRASCSIPGVFRPARIGETMYVDGGVVSPVAVEAARRYGADIIIAVDIAADLDTRPPEGTIDTILQSINIMYSKLALVQNAKADVVIRPRVGHIGSAEFERRDEAIMEGEKATIEAMPKIKAAFDSFARDGKKTE